MLSLGFALALAAAPPAGTYSIDPAASELTYEVRHPMHVVHGVSHDVRGTLVLTDSEPWLQLPCRITAPLAAFTSHNRNRDSNALTVLDARRFPSAEVRIERLAVHETARSAWEAAGKASGVLDLHGLARPLEATLTAHATGPRAIEIVADFAFALSGHHIERPSLLLLPIDDAVTIHGKLVAARQ